MSRFIQDIHNEIINAKANEPALADLNSTSQTAIWRAITYMVAVGIYSFEKILDIFKTDLEAYANTIATGTLQWYQEQCLKWQFNQDIIWNGTKYDYETTDQTLQLVTQAAVVERSDATLLVKVAKGEVGDLQPLDANELDSFTAYMNKIKFAGTKLLATSYDADTITLNYNIYYNPIYDLTALKDNVTAAINAHLQQLPFNAMLNITKLTDDIQAITGVKDVIFISANAITPTAQNITRQYQSTAGYLTAINLDNTLNFITD